MLESGNHRDRKTVLEDNIEEIRIQPTGEALLKINPTGLLTLPDFSIELVPRAGLEPARPITDNGF